MNDSAITTSSPLPAAMRGEFESLRDERDLYHSLLRADPAALTTYLHQALDTAENVRSALRSPTRDASAFRGKIERLRLELATLHDAGAAVELPTLATRVAAAQSILREVEARAIISGDDLLPAMVVLEELCCHITLAAESAMSHLPQIEQEVQGLELETSQRRAVPRLASALEQLCGKFAEEQNKRVSLVTLGLESVPEDWVSTVFDLLGQLLRNAIEHGIEPQPQRTAQAKPDSGTLVVEFVDRGPRGYELNVQDDGAGLNAERIAELAVGRGLLTAGAVQALEPARLSSLIFQPGLSTAENAASRGQGMQIVRDYVQRLGGRIHVATKRGQFMRYRIALPPAENTARLSAQRA